jgi:hypothetical protein
VRCAIRSPSIDEVGQDVYLGAVEQVEVQERAQGSSAVCARVRIGAGVAENANVEAFSHVERNDRREVRWWCAGVVFVQSGRVAFLEALALVPSIQSVGVIVVAAALSSMAPVAANKNIDVTGVCQIMKGLLVCGTGLLMKGFRKGKGVDCASTASLHVCVDISKSAGCDLTGQCRGGECCEDGKEEG